MLFLAVHVSAQESEIQVFPQDQNEFTGEKIINGLVSNGVEILDVRPNFGPESHVMGFFIDPVKYMGIGQGMMLSTGVVDNVTRESTEQNYTSMELDIAKVQESLEIYDEGVEWIGTDTNTNTLDIASTDIPTDASNFLHKYVKKGDADLSGEIKGMRTFDARVIEIDFIPTADTFYYRYVFASEEYDEYVCSQYNDIFAFYLWEDGKQKKNVALVPNKKLPVSINTVNNGNPYNKSCEKRNAYLYQKNNGKQNLLYDGFTKVLDIRQKVTPGKKYHLKIAIADASDGFWDSAVLLENGSIFSYFESFELKFDRNSSTLNSKDVLVQPLAALKNHPASKIQLIGHTDRTGTADYNLELSMERVGGIKEYLMANGIEASRIVETYKGESMPRYEQDMQNRRVELFILGE